jgi:hypothetical protein
MTRQSIIFEAPYLPPNWQFDRQSKDGGWLMQKSFSQPLLSAECEGWSCCLELSLAMLVN